MIGMKSAPLVVVAWALLAATAMATAKVAAAEEITVSGAWARETAPGGPTGAAFMTIRNAGTGDARLVAGRSEVAERVELHTHVRDGDVMRMRPVEVIEVPAGGTTELAPGGLHVMFIGLKRRLAEGEKVPLTLEFEALAPVEVAVEVIGMRAAPPAGSSGEGGGMKHH